MALLGFNGWCVLEKQTSSENQLAAFCNSDKSKKSPNLKKKGSSSNGDDFSSLCLEALICQTFKM